MSLSQSDLEVTIAHLQGQASAHDNRLGKLRKTLEGSQDIQTSIMSPGGLAYHEGFLSGLRAAIKIMGGKPQTRNLEKEGGP